MDQIRIWKRVISLGLQRSSWGLGLEGWVDEIGGFNDGSSQGQSDRKALLR